MISHFTAAKQRRKNKRRNFPPPYSPPQALLAFLLADTFEKKGGRGKREIKLPKSSVPPLRVLVFAFSVGPSLLLC